MAPVLSEGSPRAGAAQAVPAQPRSTTDLRERCAPSRPLGPFPITQRCQPSSRAVCRLAMDRPRGALCHGELPQPSRRGRGLFLETGFQFLATTGTIPSSRCGVWLGFPAVDHGAPPAWRSILPGRQHRAASLPCLIAHWDKPPIPESLWAETASGSQQPGTIRKI